MRKITILDSNYIRAFGLNGPIVTPMSVADETIKQLIANGHRVYERLSDGTNKRLTMADMEAHEAKQPAKKVAEVKETKTEVIVEQTKLEEEGKAFDGLSATTVATMPEKVEEETPVVATTKSQRKAQKKARIEAQKAAEAEAAATEEAAE